MGTVDTVNAEIEMRLGDLAKTSAALATLPFKEGDRVGISSFEGTVSSISPRYIALDTQEAVVFIPTYTMYSSIIKRYK